MNPIKETAFCLQEKLVEHRRWLHKHPEIGLSLPLTAAYVEEALKEMGLSPRRVGAFGLKATISGDPKGPVFLLRADMDGLPVVEETDLAFRSTNGHMHACGHDLHTTMLLGAAELLSQMRDDLPGTIVLMFQPAEETLQGAQAMIDAGILEDPKVEGAAMIHVFTGYPVPAGLFILPDEGPTTAASDRFRIEIQGKGGHGAMPDGTVDPLNVMSHIHLGLQAINSREVSPSDPCVVTVGHMSGGSAPNVIPDQALLEGTLRSFSDHNRQFLPERVRAISQGIASTFRAQAQVEIIQGCPALVTDGGVRQTTKKALSELFTEEAILPLSTAIAGGKLMGSEDFSFVSRQVPSIMMALTAGDAKEGHVYPMHHPKALFDEKVLWMGAAAYAAMGLQFLKDHREREAK